MSDAMRLLVTTSKALVPSSVALVSSSFLLLGHGQSMNSNEFSSSCHVGLDGLDERG